MAQLNNILFDLSGSTRLSNEDPRWNTLFKSYDALSLTSLGDEITSRLVGNNLGTGNNFMASKLQWDKAAPEDFALLAQHNFDHCRIGLKLNDYTGEAPNYTVDADQMALIKQATDWCLAEGLMAIVDPVHDWAASTSDAYDDSQNAKFVKIWQQVAAEFAAYPLESVAFELLNEPRTGYSLTNIIDSGLNAVRNTPGNEQRIVIVSGQGFSTRQALINALDDNIISRGRD